VRLDDSVEHEATRAEPAPVAIRATEARLPAAPGASTLLRLQREVGNRAVGGFLRRRRLARAAPETAPASAPAKPPAFTIPAATPVLDVISWGPTVYTAVLRNYRDAFVAYEDNCATAALETFRKLTNKGLHAVKGRQPGLRTYDRTDPSRGSTGTIDEDQTDLNWNQTKVAETVAYIKATIDRGLPLFVGVNEMGGGQDVSPTTGRPINEGVTDHFLIIVGYMAEDPGPGMWPYMPGGWRVTKLRAIDNAIDDPVLSFPAFDVTETSIRKPATGLPLTSAADFEYQVTQVRVYADDVEEMKAAAAWWN
jgi:hypothetical protein